MIFCMYENNSESFNLNELVVEEQKQRRPALRNVTNAWIKINFQRQEPVCTKQRRRDQFLVHTQLQNETSVDMTSLDLLRPVKTKPGHNIGPKTVF